MKHLSQEVTDTLAAIGSSVQRWRKVQGLTAQMLADRAGISRGTLRDIERGAGSVRLENLICVLVVLDRQDDLVRALEPLNTQIGQIRANRMLPQRVRIPTW